MPAGADMGAACAPPCIAVAGAAAGGDDVADSLDVPPEPEPHPLNASGPARDNPHNTRHPSLFNRMVWLPLGARGSLKSRSL